MQRWMLVEMRNQRLVSRLFAAAITTAAGLAAASSAQAEDPIVKLVSVESGKCLQPVNGSLAEGADIVQGTCNGSMAQQWTVDILGSGTAVHLINRSSHKCLDVRGKAQNGTPIQQWTCNWISNEKWSFGITNNLLVSLVSHTASHCVATPGTQDGLPMQLRRCDGNRAQRWNRPNG